MWSRGKTNMPLQYTIVQQWIPLLSSPFLLTAELLMTMTLRKWCILLKHWALLSRLWLMCFASAPNMEKYIFPASEATFSFLNKVKSHLLALDIINKLRGKVKRQAFASGWTINILVWLNTLIKCLQFAESCQNWVSSPTFKWLIGWDVSSLYKFWYFPFFLVLHTAVDIYIDTKIVVSE